MRNICNRNHISLIWCVFQDKSGLFHGAVSQTCWSSFGMFKHRLEDVPGDRSGQKKWWADSSGQKHLKSGLDAGWLQPSELAGKCKRGRSSPSLFPSSWDIHLATLHASHTSKSYWAVVYVWGAQGMENKTRGPWRQFWPLTIHTPIPFAPFQPSKNYETLKFLWYEFTCLEVLPRWDEVDLGKIMAGTTGDWDKPSLGRCQEQLLLWVQLKTHYLRAVGTIWWDWYGTGITADQDNFLVLLTTSISTKTNQNPSMWCVIIFPASNFPQHQQE